MPSMKQHVQIASVVAAYFFVSISLVFSNKVLITDDVSIPAPMFITWFQCVMTALICWVLGRMSIGSQAGSFLHQFPVQKYEMYIAKQIAPLSCIFVGMIAANQLTLKFVEVSFYNVARSLTIVFNVIFTYTILGKSTSSRTLATLVVVIFGFFVGTEGEVNLSVAGSAFGIISSVLVALNGIYTKRLIDVVSGNKWKLAFYNNMNACFLFLPLIFMTGEVDIILAHSHLFYSSRFWGLMLFAGFLGFAIGIVVVMQITLTSPLTHNLSGTAKACVQTILALFIWANPTTFNAMLGVALVLFGSLLYAYVRIMEAEDADRAKKTGGDIEDGQASNMKASSSV